jgi:hypothetical protein
MNDTNEAKPNTVSVPPRRRGRPPKQEVTSAVPVGENNTVNEIPTVERREMRPPLRQEDSRTAAARRTAEIRSHIGNLDEGTDEFSIPHSVHREGWTAEWKRKSVLGKEDYTYMNSLARTGWEPIDVAREPSMMPPGHIGAIERKGMILMTRPTEITEEVRAIERRRARDQIKHKESQLSSAPEGQFGRDHAQVKPSIKKGYSPIEVPQD